MKVEIGPYVKWIGPYQIAEMLCFWAKKTPDETGIPSYPKWVHDFGTRLAKDKNGNDSWLTKACAWVYSKRKRKVKIHLDEYDTWSMDETLAYIILPMLKQLRATKHGSPYVDDEDVPEELRSTSAPPSEENDANYHKRWSWVLDEMIWAFEQLHPDSNWEEQIYEEEYDVHEKLRKHRERIQKGTMLFGKYYQALWA